MIETEEQRHAIHTLYIEEYPRLLAYARSVLRDESLAAEAVQDTFLTACSKADELIGHPNPPAWLMQTLKYVVKNTYRSRAKLTALFFRILEMSANEDSSSMNEIELDATCEKLVGRETWCMLKNMLLERMSVQDVADSMGISREAAKKRLQRAHKKLEAYFRKNRS